MSTTLPIAALYSAFNNKLLDFIDDLKPLLGNLPEYNVIQSSVKFLSKFQEEQNCALFEQFVVVPYGPQIKSRDEAFLLNQDYMNSGGASSVVDLIKGVWTSLVQKDRDSIWAHMNVLVLLSEKCKGRS